MTGQLTHAASRVDDWRQRWVLVYLTVAPLLLARFQVTVTGMVGMSAPAAIVVAWLLPPLRISRPAAPPRLGRIRS